MVEQVNTYVNDGSIQANVQNSLTSKLKNASKSLEKGQTNAAVNQLQAFIHAVEAQRGKKITTVAADVLIAQAQAVIILLVPTPTPTASETSLAFLPQGAFAVAFKAVAMPRFKPGLSASYYQQTVSTTINYSYDPLYRLTAADYSTGDFYHYTYDPVGNRLTQDTSIDGLPSSVSYQYDAANRLTNVDDAAYTWDANGNLVNDGTSTYNYDSANRLTSVLGPQSSIQYSYRCNGKSMGQLGCESDRVSQTVNGVTTNYVLDSVAPLTQVLSDGTNTYAYGVDRISQTSGGTPEYFLTDGLGSVRQLTDSSSVVTLAKSYAPYGEVTDSSGPSSSAFAFTGEQQDGAMVYLRARYYSGDVGRFLSRDTWGGDYNNPLSLNRWMYVEGNPINLTDPSGLITKAESNRANEIVTELKNY